MRAYLDRVVEPDDRPLLDEAITAAASGARRGAYILTWLACAESLKRRFRTAQARDGNARKIASTIIDKEEKQNAVDRYVLDQALAYGFIAQAGHVQLSHIYTMRNVYGHPYEEAPSPEQLVSAVATVVDLVLSQPLKMRHGYLDQLIEGLTTDQHYIDDYIDRVQEVADELVPRVDDQLFEWFLQKYWKKIEPVVDDPTMDLFSRRCIWFCSRFLASTPGGHPVWVKTDWFELCRTFPRISSKALSHKIVFPRIPEHASDYLVSCLIERSKTEPSVLRTLAEMHIGGILTTRQDERFQGRIETLTAGELVSSDLPLTISFERIISLFKTYTWPKQERAARNVVDNGPEGVSALTFEQQEELGRNILQSAQGHENLSNALITNIATGQETWPTAFIRGLVEECFINEDGKIRIKKRRLADAVNILKHIPQEDAEGIFDQLMEKIRNGVLKEPRFFDERDKSSVQELLGTISMDGLTSKLHELIQTVKEIPVVEEGD